MHTNIHTCKHTYIQTGKGRHLGKRLGGKGKHLGKRQAAVKGNPYYKTTRMGRAPVDVVDALEFELKRCVVDGDPVSLTKSLEKHIGTIPVRTHILLYVCMYVCMYVRMYVCVCTSVCGGYHCLSVCVSAHVSL